MAELMKKSVAVGIAGIAAVVVAAWRQVQRDNTLDTDSGDAAGTAPAPAPREPASAAPEGAGRPDALFTPSISEKSTKAELYEIATDLEVEGRSKMNKTELLEAIRAAS